jgi:hypothetical protein
LPAAVSALVTLLENNQGAIAVDAIAGGEIPIIRLDDLGPPKVAAIKMGRLDNRPASATDYHGDARGLKQ